MTADTPKHIELVLGWWCREVARLWFVALSARRCGMASVKMETRFLMACQRKRGRTKSIYGVATLAIVKVRSAGELLSVRVLVTIAADVVLDAVKRVSPGGQMALIAGNRGVFAQEWVSGTLVP